MKTIKITTLSRHVLDIIRYVAIFYVVHVIHEHSFIHSV